MNREQWKNALALYDTHVEMLSNGAKNRITKHRAMIEAFVSGKNIEWNLGDPSGWHGCDVDRTDGGDIAFGVSTRYRIKPEQELYTIEVLADEDMIQSIRNGQGAINPAFIMSIRKKENV